MPHDAAPWKIETGRAGWRPSGPYAERYVAILTEHGDKIATFADPTAEQEDNIEHIVACVNAVPALLKALRRIANSQPRESRRGKGLVCIEDLENLQCIARLAIAKAQQALKD